MKHFIAALRLTHGRGFKAILKKDRKEYGVMMTRLLMMITLVSDLQVLVDEHIEGFYLILIYFHTVMYLIRADTMGFIYIV